MFAKRLWNEHKVDLDIANDDYEIIKNGRVDFILFHITIPQYLQYTKQMMRYLEIYLKD